LAGLGRKEFNSGDILLASEVQGYLQDQAVMVFDDATARGSAIPNPSEGMLTYNKDTSGLELYDGSAFGPVGSDAGLIHIETVSPSALTAQSINNVFTSSYRNYLIKVNLVGSGNIEVNVRLRASGTDASGANYDLYGGHLAGSYVGFSTTGATSWMLLPSFGTSRIGTNISLFSPAIATPTAVLNDHGPRNDNFRHASAGRHTLSTAYDGLTFTSTSASTFTGQISVYGFKE
jgi:hypothetical protein